MLEISLIALWWLISVFPALLAGCEYCEAKQIKRLSLNCSFPRSWCGRGIIGGLLEGDVCFCEFHIQNKIMVTLEKTSVIWLFTQWKKFLTLTALQ